MKKITSDTLKLLFELQSQAARGVHKIPVTVLEDGVENKTAEKEGTNFFLTLDKNVGEKSPHIVLAFDAPNGKYHREHIYVGDTSNNREFFVEKNVKLYTNIDKI